MSVTWILILTRTVVLGSLEQAKLGKSVEKMLEGRVTYVTGAGSGIGRAIAIVRAILSG